MSLPKYPIDFEAVQKGQLFTTAELADILGCQPESKGFPFAVMGLQRLIHKRTGFTCKITDEGLRILSDAEAAKYNHRRHMNHKRGMFKRHLLALEVDAANLNDQERKDHERNLIVQGRNIAALVEARKMTTLPRPDLPKMIAESEY